MDYTMHTVQRIEAELSRKKEALRSSLAKPGDVARATVDWRDLTRLSLGD